MAKDLFPCFSHTNKKLLILLFFICSVRASGQWQQFNLPLASSEDLYGITFIDNATFYICSNTQLSKTTNNGATWDVSNLNNPPYMANTLMDLCFYSATEGIITGAFNFTNEEYVLSTQNGGSSWSSVYSGPTNDLHFFNALDASGPNALVCGTKGHIIKSTNYGSGFADLPSSVTNNLNDIKFISSAWAIVVGDGVVLRTTDEGASWSKVAGLTSYYNSLSVGPPGSGLVYISDMYSLQKSTDNGLTYTSIELPFRDVNCVKAVGTNMVFVGTNAGIYVSLDAGVTWNKFSNTRDKVVQKIEVNNGKVYALCRNKILLVLDIATMKPEPLAAFTPVFDAVCGKTTMSTGNHSPTNGSYQWYIDNVAVSTQYDFQKIYTSASSITIKLIVKNSNGADTLISSLGVPYKVPVQADLGPDIYQCYGSSMYISTKYTAPSYEWQPESAIYSTGRGEIHTRPLYQDTKIYVKADNGDCQAYDTVTIYIDGGPIHEQFYPNEADGSEFVCDLEFFSDKLGYGLSNRDRLLKTTDGGTTWKSTAMGGTDNLFYATIDFIDENVGYIPRGYYNAQKTTDGGLTFKELNVTADLISFANKDVGVFVSRVFNAQYGDTRIYKTIDGGATFTEIYNSDKLERFFPYNIKMINENVIIMGGAYGISAPPPKMKRSLDGGATWETIAIPADAYPRYMCAISADTIFFNTYQFLYRTYDGGKNWFKYLLSADDGYGGHSTIEMLNSREGYATLGGKVFKTTNGGDCWTKVFADTTDISSHAMAFSPSGRSLFYSANKSHFTPTSKIYHRHLSRDLKGRLDSAYCEGTTIKTHNGAFGYTSSRWYLNNVLYSTAFDTVFALKEGDYTVKLKVDSLGFYPDSLTFKFHISAAPSSLGVISGQTPVCSDELLSNNTNKGNYTIVPNPDYSEFTWWVDQPFLIGSQMQMDPTTVYLYFRNSDTVITLNVRAKTKIGCLSRDTASFKIRTRNHLPPNAVSLDLHAPPCIRLDSTSFDDNHMPKDSLYCTGTPAYYTDYYMYLNAFTFPTPEAHIPIYGDCAEQVYKVTLANANVCGTSQPIEKKYSVYYEPYAITHTPDTVVAAYGPADLRIDVYPDTSALEWCNRIYPNWYFHGLDYPGWNVLHFDSVTPADTGVYTARLINGCDTTLINIRLSITSITGIVDAFETPLVIHPNPFDDVLYLQGQMNGIQVMDVWGRVEKTVTVHAETVMLDLTELKPGMYFIVCLNKAGEVTAKRKVVKR